MNKETRHLLSLDVDMNNPFEKCTFYALFPRIALDAALVGKIFRSNWSYGWKIMGTTCAATDIIICGELVNANLPKLMKK